MLPPDTNRSPLMVTLPSVVILKASKPVEFSTRNSVSPAVANVLNGVNL